MGKGLGYFTNYPKHVFLILSNEFCERFSYYGMKAILVIYLTRALKFDDNTATAIYHAFNVVCYFTPLLGAMLADGLLGKYRTIMYVSVVYALGNVVMTIAAIPVNGVYSSWAPFIGLTIIAFGTGGIKPCVSSFGGDQFSPDQQRQKDSFFSLFYMAINVGSLLSTIITPMIRSKVYCFDDNCYALAFGIPAILMVVAIILFAIGSRWYTKTPPGESIISRMFGCIGTALGGKLRCNKDPEDKKEHWLDYAEPKYDKAFIADVKDVMSVCWLFLPLPVFWALFDQQGSRWTLQATQLNGDFGSFVMQPDMMQMLNALLVVLFVPLLESLIYPCLDKLKIPNRPLQRMGWGMIFAATAFLLAGVLQIFIDQEAPVAVAAGQMKYNYVNAASCPIRFPDPMDENNMLTVSPFDNTDYYYVTHEPTKEITFSSHCNGTANSTDFSVMFNFEEMTTYQIILDDQSVSELTAHLFIQERVVPTPKGESAIRIYNTLDEEVTVKLSTTGSQESKPRELGAVMPHNVSEYENLIFADFYMDIIVPSEGNTSIRVPQEIESKNGAVSTILLMPKTASGTYEIKQLEDIPTRTINIFIQVPQYLIMTVGECLFSVSGLAFAYSQAATSMKSILTAIWLLTVAIGNVVVVIVAETGSSMSQMAEFFLFSAIMYVTTVIFVIMCMFYKYVEPREYVPTEDEEKKVGMDGGEEYVMDDKDGMSPLEAKEQEAKANTANIENGGDTENNDEERTRRESRVSSRASRRNNRVSPEV